MARATDHVQITADNTDVRSGRIKIPTWARFVRLQLVASDTDWTHKISIDGKEFVRDGGPDWAAADNVEQGFDYTKSHVHAPITPDSEIKWDVNVVTAGVGVAGCVFES